MASNGDLGRILDCITDEDGNARAVIGFPDGRQVQYEADQMEMIEHANATTIHKAQGSECPVVIIPWVKAFYMMLEAQYSLYRSDQSEKQGLSGRGMGCSLSGNPYG